MGAKRRMKPMSVSRVFFIWCARRLKMRGCIQPRLRRLDRLPKMCVGRNRIAQSQGDRSGKVQKTCSCAWLRPRRSHFPSKDTGSHLHILQGLSYESMPKEELLKLPRTSDFGLPSDFG